MFTSIVGVSGVRSIRSLPRTAQPAIESEQLEDVPEQVLQKVPKEVLNRDFRRGFGVRKEEGC